MIGIHYKITSARHAFVFVNNLVPRGVKALLRAKSLRLSVRFESCAAALTSAFPVMRVLVINLAPALIRAKMLVVMFRSKFGAAKSADSSIFHPDNCRTYKENIKYLLCQNKGYSIFTANA
jgi:hypothetical protein